MGLRQSISGALQRVSGLRSPSGGPEPGESCLLTWLTEVASFKSPQEQLALELAKLAGAVALRLLQLQHGRVAG